MRLVLVTVFVVLAVAALAGDNKWTSSGPFGGTFTGFCFHPRVDTLMFASSWSGIFRSQNSGVTWKRLSLLESGPVIRIHPLNPETVIAAGHRLYSSTNRGDSWQEISSGVSDSFSDLEFHPTNPLILYGAARSLGIYKSTDGGRTWTPKNSGLNLKTVGWGGSPQLEVDPSNGNTLFILLQSHLAYRSSNGGESWQSINTGVNWKEVNGTHSLAINPKNSKILFFGTDQNIYRTTDAGGHWFKVVDAGSGAVDIAVDATNPQNVYGVGWGITWKSTNGGSSWARLSVDTRDIESVAVHPKRNSLVFIGGTGQGIFRSQNAGNTWQMANGGLDAQQVSRIAAQQNRVFAVNGRVLFESTNGGVNWNLSSLSRETRVTAGDVRIHPRNSNFVAVGANSIAVSKDAGKTWVLGASEYFYSNLVALDPGDQKIIYLAPTEWTRQGIIDLGLAKSVNGGESWRLMNSGLSNKSVAAIAVDPRKGSNVLVGTDSGIFKSANGGAAWKNSSAGLTGGHIFSIAFDPANSSIVYAAGDGGIFKSVDGGKTWSRKFNQGWTAFVAVDPVNSRNVFTGAFGSVFLSVDSGETWSAFDSAGLGPFTITDFLIDPASRDRFYVGTERGVFSYTRKGAAGGPVIEQLSPGGGKVGSSVTINGRAFGQVQGTSRVSFGSTDAATAQSWTDTSIKVLVPNGAHTAPVTVTVSNRKSNPYEFIILPASGNIEPSSGPSGGGTRVTILGPSGISGTQFNVLFGSVVARNIRFTQPNIITCDSPPGSGTVDVSVTSSAVVAKVGTFTYL
jgi:photosystem II stability/assembly factor-like uncharacterized protein